MFRPASGCGPFSYSSVLLDLLKLFFAEPGKRAKFFHTAERAIFFSQAHDLRSPGGPDAGKLGKLLGRGRIDVYRGLRWLLGRKVTK